MECSRCGNPHPEMCWLDEDRETGHQSETCLCADCAVELEFEQRRPYGEETHA